MQNQTGAPCFPFTKKDVQFYVNRCASKMEILFNFNYKLTTITGLYLVFNRENGEKVTECMLFLKVLHISKFIRIS